MMTPGVGGRRWERQRPVGTRFLTDRQNLSRSTMPTTSTIHPDGIAEVVMDNPPVNALTVGGWFELADILNGLGRDPAVRVVVLRAEGRGFNAGRSEEHTSELQSLMSISYAVFCSTNN